MTGRPARAASAAGLIFLAVVGCHGPGRGNPVHTRLDREETRLDQIPIPPIGPPPARSEASSAPPDAIRYYVAGRSELSADQPRLAVADFLRADAADGGSVDVLFDLGRADEAVGDADAAIVAYDRASAIDPAAVAPSLAAGRLLQQAGRSDDAVDRLHRALNSPELLDNGEGLAVHLWLARALGSAGYLAAAFQQFNFVVDRLNHATNDLRNDPSIHEILRRPAILDLDRADLLESQQRFDLAGQVLSRAVDVEPDDAELTGRLVDDLIKTGVPGVAVQRAVSLVAADHATSESVAILTKACAAATLPIDPVDQLIGVSDHHPTDAGIRSAAIDALAKSGRPDDALAFCVRCHVATPGDPSATADLLKLLLAAGRPLDGARAILETASADPDAVDRLAPVWATVTRPGAAASITPTQLNSLAVPPTIEGARDWYLSQLLDAAHRKGESADALRRATTRRPVFAPAFLAALDRIDGDDRQTSDWKTEQAGELATAADHAGAPWLAAELRGRSLVDAGKLQPAAEQFAAAMKLNPRSARARYLAAKVAGSAQEIRFALWQNVSAFPTFVANYQALQAMYLADPVTPGDELDRLAEAWSAAMPDEAGALLFKARLAVDRGNDAGAEKVLSGLTDRTPDDPAVFDAARAFYSRVGKSDVLARRLQSRLEINPRDVPLLAEVVTLFTSMKRTPEAVRVLDASRAALAGDPTGLYPLANLYSKAGEPAAAVAVLRDVLKLDPHFAAACNDLAFYLIDAGTDYASAKDLVDRALAIEPDNPSFLDSAGWLQFKQGNFPSATATLSRAVGPAVGGDPAVLDHYGDALARSGRPVEARQAWEKALSALGELPDAQPALRLQLMSKLGKKAVGGQTP